MYIKIIKKGNKQYKYYYHNIKKQGKVKNIFLSNKKQEALAKLKELKNEHFEFKKEIPKNNCNLLYLKFFEREINNVLRTKL